MAALLPVVLAGAFIGTAGTAGAATGDTAGGGTGGDKPVCAAPAPGQAQCLAHVKVHGDQASPAATTTYTSGYNPGQLRTAYKTPGAATSTGASPGPLVAVIDAYANPNAAGDLAAYRTRFGLGPATLTQVDQRGATTLPAGDVGWGEEEALDLDMVSAMCPACPILYVGADSPTFSDLAAAVTRAHTLGAKVISNSYGAREFSGETTYQSAYNLTDTVVTVSSGDSGYGVEFPASAKDVVAVGGTTLKLNADGSRQSEKVWSGTGSGCSAYISKPTWQKDKACSRRTVVDVAAVADPNTGVAVYDSYGSSGGANWLVFGGTSVSAPLVGAYIAAAGIPAPSSSAPYPVASLYAQRSSGGFFDVTSGSNGSCGSSSSSKYYLCHGVGGYDGPTGLGTPKSPVAF
jgi:subtilase family serine protease